MNKKLALAVLLLSATWAASAAQQGSDIGLVNGVQESTDPDRIDKIEEHARQLESKRGDNYEAPAAGKRHKHGHHGGRHGRKPAAPAAGASATQ